MQFKGFLALFYSYIHILYIEKRDGEMHQNRMSTYFFQDPERMYLITKTRHFIRITNQNILWGFCFNSTETNKKNTRVKVTIAEQ